MAPRKRKGLPINGWLVIDKPEGMTSTQAVAMVKRLTNAQKVGHGGTLDPLATGVLPIAMGEATKTVAWIMDSHKSYAFTIRLGEARDTDDSTGVVVRSSETRPGDAEIRAALDGFIGHIKQRPPDYAAVKIAGERAYDIARRGDEVVLEPREVRVDELSLVDRPDADRARFHMVCGKGAYVRAIARDLGEALGCYAHVVALRRTEVGAFSAADAVTPDALAGIVENETLPQVLVPVATALAGIPALAVTEPQAIRLRAGQPIRVSPALVAGEVAADGTVRAMRSGQIVALARIEGADLSPLRVFHLS